MFFHALIRCFWLDFGANCNIPLLSYRHIVVSQDIMYLMCRVLGCFFFMLRLQNCLSALFLVIFIFFFSCFKQGHLSSSLQPPRFTSNMIIRLGRLTPGYFRLLQVGVSESLSPLNTEISLNGIRTEIIFMEVWRAVLRPTMPLEHQRNSGWCYTLWYSSLSLHPSSCCPHNPLISADSPYVATIV